jgi:hypothetical protein
MKKTLDRFCTSENPRGHDHAFRQHMDFFQNLVSSPQELRRLSVNASQLISEAASRALMTKKSSSGASRYCLGVLEKVRFRRLYRNNRSSRFCEASALLCASAFTPFSSLSSDRDRYQRNREWIRIKSRESTQYPGYHPWNHITKAHRL